MRIQNYHLLLIISALFLSISCENRGTKVNLKRNQIPASEKKDSSGIGFITEIHNFGTLKVGEIVSYSFVFMNKGVIPVRIEKAEPSCGCVRVKYDKKEIASGDKSAIEVVFNTAGEWGNQLKMVEVETSSGEKKELKIGAYIDNEQFNNLLNTQK